MKATELLTVALAECRARTVPTRDAGGNVCITPPSIHAAFDKAVEAGRCKSITGNYYGCNAKPQNFPGMAKAKLMLAANVDSDITVRQYPDGALLLVGDTNRGLIAVKVLA